MDRDRALPLVIALLAIVALSLSAATLDSAVVDGGASGLGGGEGSWFGDDGGETGTGSENRSSGAEDAGVTTMPIRPCWPVLQEPPVVLALVLLFAGLFAVVYRSTRSVLAGALVCGLLGLPVGLVWSALATCEPPQSEGEATATPAAGAANETRPPAGGSGGIGSAGADALSSPTLLLVLLVGVAVVVVLVAALVAGSEAGGGSDAPAPALSEEPTAAIGRAAGAAADRIDADADVDAENEVYRAWRRMTASLDVDSPSTTTPREFERAAVAAGMDREDVAALTSLFESVRYGGSTATEERERRAVETLRRIESSYGGD